MLKKIISFINQYIYTISLYSRQIAGTVVIFLIARYLSVFDFGLFSSYKNIAAYCFVLANLNYNDYILVSSNAEPTKVRQKVGLFITHSIILGIIFSLLSLLFKLDSHILFILIVARTFFDGVFFSLILPYFQATKKFTQIAIINILYAIGVTIIAVVSYLLQLTLIQFLILNIILGIINFLQCSYYTKINYFGVLFKIKKYLKLLDKKIFGYIGSSITVNLYTPLPALFVSLTAKKEDAALFFAAFTIAAIPNLFISAQSQKIIAEMIKTTALNIKNIIKKNLKIVIVVTISLFLFMSVFGKQILVLFYGKEYYTNAYLILLLLLSGNIFYGISSIFSVYITASGNQSKKIPIQLKLVACTIICLFLFQKLSIYGAVYTYIITMIYMLIEYIIFSTKYINKKISEEIKTNNN